MARTPESAKFKDKMLTESSESALRYFLIGIAAEIEASDYSDVEYDSGELFPSSPALRTYFLP